MRSALGFKAKVDPSLGIIFVENCMKMKKNGNGVSLPPVDPPMII